MNERLTDTERAIILFAKMRIVAINGDEYARTQMEERSSPFSREELAGLWEEYHDYEPPSEVDRRNSDQ